MLWHLKVQSDVAEPAWLWDPEERNRKKRLRAVQSDASFYSAWWKAESSDTGMAGYPKSVLNYAIKRYGRLWLDCAVHELFCLLYQNCQRKHEMRLKIVKTAHIHSTIFSCTMRAWVSRQCGFDGTFPNLRLVQCSGGRGAAAQCADSALCYQFRQWLCYWHCASVLVVLWMM